MVNIFRLNITYLSLTINPFLGSLNCADSSSDDVSDCSKIHDRFISRLPDCSTSKGKLSFDRTKILKVYHNNKDLLESSPISFSGLT
jgi:hypothetical protein